MLVKQLKAVKKYPRFEPWDHIANSQEEAELERLSRLQKDIHDSKDAFQKGWGEVLTASCFRTTQTVNTVPLNSINAVFISPLAKAALTEHIQQLHQEAEEYSDQDADWLIQQLQDFFLTKLPANSAGGQRQDLLHRGVRVQLLGFYEIYYFFDGKYVYIAQITRNKRNH